MNENVVWHLETLSAGAHQTLRLLSGHSALRPFYLAGSTAIALRLGHRISVDLDFFCEGPVSEDLLLSSLQSIPELAVIAKAPELSRL